MAKEQLAVIKMITNMILGKTNGVSKVDFTPQKIPFPENLPYEQAFLRATPESQGVSSEKLIHLLSNLSASPYTDMHHFLVLRHGNVICDCSFAPYRSGIWHISHSMCKSITSMAIGLLIDEGKLSLDENIYNIFPGKVNPLIGAAGVSAVPMAARVAQKVGAEADPTNFLLMHAMGPNVAGVIGTAVAAGTFMAIFGV